MNGENPEAQQPVPTKIEALPKAESPGVENGAEKSGLLNPAELRIKSIIGEPGTKREKPRDVLKLVAETPDPALAESPEAKRAAIDRIAQQQRAEADAKARQQEEADAQAKQKADTDAAKKAALDARAAEVTAGPRPAAETQSPPAPTGEKQIVDPAAQDAKSARQGQADHDALISKLNAESEARMAKKATRETAEKTTKNQTPFTETPPPSETPATPPTVEALAIKRSHMSPDEIKDINDRIKTGGASDRETQQAEKPAAEADTTIHGEAPPIEPAVTISPDKLRQIDQRIKTGGASDRETPQTATQTQPPATEAPTETPVSTIPAEQATPADQPQVFGEVPSLPDAGQSPVEQLPTVQSVEKPAAAADTQPNKFTQGNENNQEKAAELKQQAKQNLEARLVETGASEANKTKVLEEFDKDPAAVLNAEQSVKNIIANPNAETNKPNEEIQTGSAQKPEQQEINIEQKRKEALGEVVYKMSEYNITPDKQANVLAMLSANPDMLIDTASVINNLQIEKKEDMDPQAQMHEAIKKRIQELKDKIDPDKKGVNNLTDDEKKQLKALNLLNDALSKETDEFTKSQLLLLLFAAVIAGTLEGLKEGIEQSAKL